jgi:hypothetical protein
MYQLLSFRPVRSTEKVNSEDDLSADMRNISSVQMHWSSRMTYLLDSCTLPASENTSFIVTLSLPSVRPGNGAVTWRSPNPLIHRDSVRLTALSSSQIPQNACKRDFLSSSSASRC